MLETIKRKLIKLLINSTWKYNKSECKDKWMETTIDDIKFLIEELNFPFLKKMLLKLDEESAYSTYEIIKKLDHEIFDEINSEIKENRLLRGFISVS